MNSKIKWLRNKLNGLNMQGMIVTNPVNIKYLTNIEAEGILLITRKENIFLTDSRYIEHVNAILTIEDGIVVYNIKDLILDDYENFFLFCENVGFEEEYVTYAKQHLNYLMGVNATGYCFVTGCGTLSPEHPHHRPSEVLEKCMPGMLVGGPDNGMEDPYAKAVFLNTAPAKCYVDNAQSYSTNEVTIYWNSPLIYLMVASQK